LGNREYWDRPVPLVHLEMPVSLGLLDRKDLQVITGSQDLPVQLGRQDSKVLPEQVARAVLLDPLAILDRLGRPDPRDPLDNLEQTDFLVRRELPARQEPLDHRAELEIPDPQDPPDQLVPREIRAMSEPPGVQELKAWRGLRDLWATMAPSDCRVPRDCQEHKERVARTVIPALQGMPGRMEIQVRLESLDLWVNQAPRALLDLPGHPVHKVRSVHQAWQVPRVVPVDLEVKDPRDLLDRPDLRDLQARQVLQVRKEIPDHKVALVHLAQEDCPDLRDLKDQTGILDHRDLLVFLVDLDQLVGPEMLDHPELRER